MISLTYSFGGSGRIGMITVGDETVAFVEARGRIDH